MMTAYDIFSLAIELKNSSTDRLKDNWTIGGLMFILEDAYRLEDKNPKLYEYRKMIENAIDRMMK